MKLCDKIAKLRKREGLSQEELADKLEVSRQSVFKWESGENTPDLEKIKKLARLFNVSFDLLLDDDKDIEPIQNEEKNESKESPKTFAYRKVFNSGRSLNTLNQGNLENGYVEGVKKIKTLDYPYTKKCEENLKNRKYSKTIKIQHDTAFYFFVDESNKTFGFYFDGAPQFICPFENLASFTGSNTGIETGYVKATGVGVGFGKNPSIGVGSMPLAQTRSPLRYDLSISYFDEKGTLKDYKLGISCSRGYIVYNGTVDSPDSLYLWENLLSQSTNKNLGEVSSYLNGIKEAANQIKSGAISVSQIDFDKANNEYKVANEERIAFERRLKNEAEAAAKKRRKTGLIIFLVIASLVAVGIGTCSISNAVKQNQITQTNKNKAQDVIDMIDNLGEITLSSESAIKRAENAYKALTDEQKSYVTNYSKLTSARSQYERLAYQQREEETKDDPSRTIVVTDMNGRWECAGEEWAIADIQGGTAVLYWTTGSMASVFSGTLKSSYAVGYNNETRRMELKLYHYTALGGEYLDVSMTKSSSGTLNLYFRSKTFVKTSNS